MSDVGLTWSNELGAADFTIVENDYQTDDGLETAVFISLFTDRRAEPSDPLPSDDLDLRGWWADVDDDLIGSRLWLLSRAKLTSDIPGLAEGYAKEALQWLLDDQVASRVDAQSEIIGNDNLNLTVSVTRPDGNAVSFRYNYNWVAQAAKRA